MWEVSALCRTALQLVMLFMPQSWGAGSTKREKGCCAAGELGGARVDIFMHM